MGRASQPRGYRVSTLIGLLMLGVAVLRAIVAYLGQPVLLTALLLLAG